MVLVLSASGCNHQPSSASDAGASSCATIRCAPPVLCSVGCQEQCGCCNCDDGEMRVFDARIHHCTGGCFVPGPADAGGNDSCLTTQLVVAPARGLFEEAGADAGLRSWTTTVDVAACRNERAFTYLPLGSAWFLVHPVNGECEIWLGGETECLYGGCGGPRWYCRFDRNCSTAVEVTVNNGGPAYIVSSGCLLLIDQ